MHQVGCRLAFDVIEPSAIALQVAPAGTSGALVTERLEIVDAAGRPPVSVVEVGVAHGGRIGAEIRASTDEALPVDDHVAPVRLP